MPKYRFGRGEESIEDLFPNSLSSPGWNHRWDLNLRRTFAQLPWFKAWMEQSKGIIELFRDRNAKKRLSDLLKQLGKLSLAATVKGTTTRAFAKCRWTTLVDCAEDTENAVAALGGTILSGLVRMGQGHCTKTGSRRCLVFASLESPVFFCRVV